MKLYYFALKWSMEANSNDYRYALYRYDPGANTYTVDGKGSMTLGQMLCHIGCSDLDNWHYVDRESICDFWLMHYCYPIADPGHCDVEMYIVEGKPNALEPIQTGSKGTGGHNMRRSIFSYNLEPAEFQEIYNLLKNEREKLENVLKDADTSTESVEPMIARRDLLLDLSTRMRADMDKWLLHYPRHAYVQWRMHQLRGLENQIKKKLHLDNSEEV